MKAPTMRLDPLEFMFELMTGFHRRHRIICDNFVLVLPVVESRDQSGKASLQFLRVGSHLLMQVVVDHASPLCQRKKRNAFLH